MAELDVLLRSLREAAGLTQEELAERAGVSARTISDAERGIRTRIYAETAQRLANGLVLDPTDRDALLVAARGRGRPAATSVGTLPRPITSLLGRQAELDLVDRELRPNGTRRLVTVTGLGGTGKSRLAIAAAQRLVPAYEGRVCLVALSDVGRAASLPEAVAVALGTLPDRIAVASSGRPTLLVLDAFERALPAAADLESLLSEAPEVRALVTSRVRLRIPGERELALGPLPPADAAKLFSERAADLASQVEDDPELVGEICALVSGLPLPLELAAAHVRYLPLSLIRDQLRAGRSDASHVVRDAVAWSLASLSDQARKVLSCAAQFAGGWRLDGLQAVSGDVDVLTALEGLADGCLIVLDPGGPVPRWRMLDAVRECASNIDPRDVAFRTAYVSFHLALLDEVGKRIGHDEAWHQVLAAEEPNIRTALDWAEQDGDAETLLGLATGMWLFWQARGALDEGRRWLTRGLSMRPGAREATQMTALWGLAWLAYHQGDDEAAEVAGRQLSVLASASGDDAASRNALTISGMVAIARDQPAEAVASLTEALDVARRLDRPWILAASFLNLGLGHLAAADADRARPLLAEALQRYDAVGDPRFRARSLGYLGLASLLDGDPSRAKALFGQSLQAFRDLADPTGIAEGLAGIAAAEAAERPAFAAMLAGAASRVRETVAARELPLERRVSAQHLAAAADALGRDAWEGAWKRGRSATESVAVAWALDGLGDDSDLAGGRVTRSVDQPS